ncbi:MAG: hypothetical protein ACE5OZ_13185 [Candidatus Heimdallarchaeota archaeon]
MQQRFELIAAKEFTNGFDEQIRQLFGIRTVFEEVNLVNRGKIGAKKLIGICKSGIKLSNEQTRSFYCKKLSAAFWYQIYSWYKLKAKNSSLKGVEIIGFKRNGHISVRQVEFISKDEIMQINEENSFLAMKSIEDKALELAKSISELITPHISSPNIITTSDLLGVTSKKRNITRWSKNRYNAFRRAFEDRIHQFEDKHNWVKIQGIFQAKHGKKELHPTKQIWNKMETSDEYFEIIKSCKRLKCGVPARKVPPAKFRAKESINWYKGINKGIAKVKMGIRPIDVRINKLTEDVTHNFADNGTKLYDHFRNILNDIEKTSSLPFKEINRFKNYLSLIWHRILGRIRPEFYYQFLIEAAWRNFPLSVLNKASNDDSRRELAIIISDAHSKKSKWEFMNDMSISNLNHHTHKYGVIDHIYVYKRKTTSEYAIIGMQDKILIPNKFGNQWIKGSNSSAEYAKDVHQLQNLMMGLFNEIQQKKKTGKVDRWGHLDRGIYWNMTKGDRKRLAKVVELSRNSDNLVSFYSCMRFGGFDEKNLRITLAFVVWKPETANVWHSVHKFKETSGHRKQFGHTLERILQFIDEGISQGEWNDFRELSFVSTAFWGINERSSSFDEADTIFRLVRNKFDELAEEATGLAEIPYSNGALEALGYQKLGKLVSQIELLSWQRICLHMQTKFSR